MRGCFASALVSSLLALSTCGDAVTTTGTRSVALESCRLEGLARAATCGVVRVAEDRRNPAGNVIDLRVAVVPARTQSARAVFWLAGGPGQAATEAFPPLLEQYDELGRTHDFVLMDQRGSGSSGRLACESPTERLVDVFDVAFDVAKLKACLASYTADPTQYTTAATVEDIEAVRVSLGYDKIALVGGSYGTRLGLAYLRAHPERVEAAVLDGMAPPWMLLPLHFAVDGQAALDALLSRCESATACSAAFPRLRERLNALLLELEQAPIEVTMPHPRTGVRETFVVGRETFVGGLRGILYAPDLVALLPLALHRAAERDFAPFAAMVHTIANAMSDAMSSGLFLSIVCSEDLPHIDRDEASELARGSFAGNDVVTRLASACEVWPHHTVPQPSMDLSAVDVPVLVLSGKLDPVTPPRWGDDVARRLPRARHLVVPAAGHGTLSVGCMPDLVSDFVVTADAAALDPACLERREPPPLFIDFAGPEQR